MVPTDLSPENGQKPVFWLFGSFNNPCAHSNRATPPPSKLCQIINKLHEKYLSKKVYSFQEEIRTDLSLHYRRRRRRHQPPPHPPCAAPMPPPPPPPTQLCLIIIKLHAKYLSQRVYGFGEKVEHPNRQTDGRGVIIYRCHSYPQPKQRSPTHENQ